MKIRAKFLMSKEDFLSLLNNKNVSITDKILKTVIEILISETENDININLSDIKFVLENGKEVFLGVVQGSQNDIYEYFLEELDKSKALLVYFGINENYPFLKIQKYMNLLKKRVYDNGDVLFGTYTDNSLKNDEIFIILLSVE